MASRNRLKQTSLNFFFKANSNLPTTSPLRETPVTVSTPVDTIINNSTDEEEEQTAPRLRKRKRIIPVEEEDDDNETTTTTNTRTTITLDSSNVNNNGSDEEDVDMSPPPSVGTYKRRLLRRKAISSDDEDMIDRDKKHKSETEDSDEDNIQDDLDFLGDNDVYQERTRVKKKSQYALALEKLKNRKQRSFDGSEGPMDRYRSNNNNESIIDSEEEEEEQGSEQDFIVDDDIIDGVKMDRPNEPVSLPAAFSTAKTQRFSTNFKIYVEFLLETVLEKDTQSLYFQQAISMVERRVRGLKDSLITSDAWRPEFKMALDRYPIWNPTLCKGLICEGCRQNRAASFEVVLAAEPEDTETEPREKPFSLGSECYKRAKVYHKLVHFRSHLYKHVRNEAEAFMNEGDPEQQLECLTEDNIIKAMHSSGFVKLLYQQTQSLFSQAQSQYMPTSGKKSRSSSSRRIINNNNNNDDDDESYSEEEV